MDVGEDGDTHRRRTIARWLVALAVAGLWAAAAALLLRTRVPTLELPPVDPSSILAPDALARAERYREVTRLLWIVTVAVQLAVLALLAWKGHALARIGRRAARGRARAGMAVAALVVLAVWLASLAPGAVAHRFARRDGLALAGYGRWLAERSVVLAVLLILTACAVGVFLGLARRFPSRWWIPGWTFLAVCGVAVALLQPVVLEPLLGRTRPLGDASLAGEIEALATRLGTTVGAVRVSDASSRTTIPNARVIGLGPTRAIVLDDTLLDGRLESGAVRAVAAHELAHVARSHVWKGVAWFALLALPGTALLAWLVGRRGQLGGPEGPALVPLALLAAFALYLGTLPVQTAISRRYEAEADWLALVATRDPGGVEALERTVAREALLDPEPPAWSQIVRATHPTVADRVAMARAFARRDARGALRSDP